MAALFALKNSNRVVIALSGPQVLSVERYLALAERDGYIRLTASIYNLRWRRENGLLFFQRVDQFL